MVLVVTLHGSARVSARIDANQRARLTLAKIMERASLRLHRSEVAPVRADSTGTKLNFSHLDQRRLLRGAQPFAA